MISLLINTATQAGKLAFAAAISAGPFDVPIAVEFTAAGEFVDLQLSISSTAVPPTVLAYTEAFAAVTRDRKFVALLDANDTRLATHMAAATGATSLVNLEFTYTVDGVQVPPIVLPVTVRRTALTGPATSEGGPFYFTQGQTNTRIAELLTAALDELPEPDAVVSQAEAEAGVSTGYRRWSPLRVKQAIVALTPAPSGDLAALEALSGTGFAKRTGTNTWVLDGTTYATSSDVTAAIAALVGAAPTSLDTLVEIAAALNDDADLAGTLTTAIAGKQAAHANLTAFSGLSLVAGKLPYADGTGTLALADLTAAGRALLDDADAAAQRTTLGLGTAATTAATDYAPAAQGIAADSGWTANDDAGSKAEVIPTASAISIALGSTPGITLGVNISTEWPAVGALITALAGKVKAIETALAGALRPHV